MISLKQFQSYNSIIELSFQDSRTTINGYSYSRSGVARVYQTSRLGVGIIQSLCSNPVCFHLLFSFHPEHRTPQQLPSSLFNCSVDYYSSFLLHLDCNLKAECEDGEDETEHCPFSSPACQGMVSSCNRCYKPFRDLRAFESDATDVNERANEYCELAGGVLGVPKCVFDFTAAFRGERNMRMLSNIYWVGLSVGDVTLPDMYKHSMVSEDKTVIYHSVNLRHYKYTGEKSCLVLSNRHLEKRKCQVGPFSRSFGGICEIKAPRAEGLGGIALPCTECSFVEEQQSLWTCSAGHFTHTFIVCGSLQFDVCGGDVHSPCIFSKRLLSVNISHTASAHTPPAPLFVCSDSIMVSYTLTCDFRNDCQDQSDESFCVHPHCIGTFACSNGQCISNDNICDKVSHCSDDSDEQPCLRFKEELQTSQPFFPSPALVDFDGVATFTSGPMSHNDSCPHTHYRCPGDLNDCLPVFTRCNGMYDCVDQQDEMQCQDVVCPGFLRCRASTICVHSSHLCDGWPHCPHHDDELACHTLCPDTCLCHGHSFLCHQPFAATLYPHLRYLDATGSGISLSDLSNSTYLVHLILAQCSISVLPQTKLFNLRFFDVSNNKLNHINLSSIFLLQNLRTFLLSNNPVTSLYAVGISSSNQENALATIDFSYTALGVFGSEVLSQFSRLQKLNLTSTGIHTISPDGFRFLPQLTELYMKGTPVKTFPRDIFKGLSSLHVIFTENYKLCCDEIIPENVDGTLCYAPKDDISSCEDLLQSWSYRGFLWLITCLSVIGNVSCFLVRLLARTMTSSNGFSVFVTNLTLADLLMGVYIAIIGAADEHFRGQYLHHDDTWKSSGLCKVAGFLSLLSSEVSALIIWLITLDRFVVIHFPFSNLRFERTSAISACALVWALGLCLALLPLLPAMSHWEFYSQTGIGIPLPVTRRNFSGRVYAIGVLIILNFVLFLLISIGQAFIYWSVQKNALKTNSTKVSKDLTIARRLITVAATDFMCWFPVGLCGILALTGMPMPAEVNVALAIFVLPLNSALNPFVYTFNTVAEKQRKLKEEQLLKWLESHADLLSA